MDGCYFYGCSIQEAKCIDILLDLIKEWNFKNENHIATKVIYEKGYDNQTTGIRVLIKNSDEPSRDWLQSKREWIKFIVCLDNYEQ